MTVFDKMRDEMAASASPHEPTMMRCACDGCLRAARRAAMPLPAAMTGYTVNEVLHLREGCARALVWCGHLPVRAAYYAESLYPMPSALPNASVPPEEAL